MNCSTIVRLRRLVFLSVILLAGFRPHALHAAAESAEALYRQAYVQETINRDAAKAIELYKQVISMAGDQGLSAKVHLRLGLCYEKLGRLSDARLSYKDVLDMGADVPSAVAGQAREHLQRLTETVEHSTPPPAETAGANLFEPVKLLGRWEASFLAGAAVPVDNDILREGNPSMSGLIQASILYDVLPWLSIGPELGYSPSHSLGFEVQNLAKIDYSLSVFQFTPEIQAGPWIKTKNLTFKPYGVLGGGLYYTTESIDASYYQSSFFNTSDKASGAHGGFNAGGGILLKIGDNFAVGPDFRYHYILSSNSNFHYLATQARLAYLF